MNKKSSTDQPLKESQWQVETGGVSE